jgi:hypothetical protein
MFAKLIDERGHLYRYHRVHQCQRCKDLFNSQEELDTHIEALEGCDLRALEALEPLEGITSKVKERLQCRKKAYPGQSEADRWKDIYRVLFPNEEVPSPCKFTLYARISTQEDLVHFRRSGMVAILTCCSLFW